MQEEKMEQSVNPDAGPPSEDEIRVLAYAYWEECGGPIGTPEVDWFRAERDLLAQHQDTGESPLITAAKAVGAVVGSVVGLVLGEISALAGDHTAPES